MKDLLKLCEKHPLKAKAKLSALRVIQITRDIFLTDFSSRPPSSLICHLVTLSRPTAPPGCEVTIFNNKNFFAFLW